MDSITLAGVASVVSGILKRGYGGGRIRTREKVTVWSEIVIKSEEAAIMAAWDVANRVCRAKGRELIPRDPQWLYQDDATVKKGSGLGHLQFTISGVRPDMLKDVSYWKGGTRIERVYDVFEWGRESRGYIEDQERSLVGRIHQRIWHPTSAKVLPTYQQGQLSAMWHNGMGGNENADAEARKAGWMGTAMHKPEIATPAGIRQHLPLSTKPAHMRWDREGWHTCIRTAAP